MKIGTVREVSHAARDWLRKVRKAGRDLFMIDRAIGAIRRLPVVISLGAVRHAPRGCRMKIFRGAIRSLSTPAPAGPAEVCEINSLTDFDSGFARLAAMLGHAGRRPSPGELEFLNSIAGRRTSYPGNIGPSDYLFLTAFVSILAPQRVIEIGTLTGFSAGIIAAALARRHGSGRNGARPERTAGIILRAGVRTPFHQRVAARDRVSAWRHWHGHDVARRLRQFS